MTSKGSGVREIVLLTLGWEHLPKSVSVEGAPADEPMVCPVPGILLLCDGGWLLLDTGFNTALIRDAALRRRFYGDPTYSVVLPGPGEPLEEALAFAGIMISDVTAVGLSHLHVDHVGGLKHFTGVPVHCQRRELEYGLSGHPEPERNAIYRIDFDDPRHDWRLADGDVEIAPGVTAISTPGHTPGHQSFVVDLDESVGRWRLRLRLRRGRSDREHRGRGVDRRPDRRDARGGASSRSAAQGPGAAARLPARARARPRGLAGADPRAGRPVPRTQACSGGGVADLAARHLGAGVVAASDDAFGPKELLLSPGPVSFVPGTFDHKGEVVDGWETRRRRTPGHDWAIVRLGVPGVIRTVDVDTTSFAGNCSVDLPGRGLRRGRLPGPDGARGLADHRAAHGTEGRTPTTSSPSTTPRRWTHVRLSIEPDGGVGRLRVEGEPMP